MNLVSKHSVNCTLRAMLVGLWSLTLLTPTVMAQNPPIPADRQAVIEIVRLQHKDPDIVRAAIAPHLDERGAISQIDHNLIISTSRANLDELETIIAQIDVPAKQLLIRVNFNYGEVAVQTPDDGSQTDNISTQRNETPIQSMVVTEGESVYFNRFSDTPLVSPAFGPYGLQVQQDIQRSEQSIALTAQLSGAEAIVEYAAAEQQVGAGTNQLQGQSSRSSLRIPLNRWVALQANDVNAGLFFDDTRFLASTNRDSGLAVRIEVMP